MFATANLHNNSKYIPDPNLLRTINDVILCSLTLIISYWHPYIFCFNSLRSSWIFCPYKRGFSSYSCSININECLSSLSTVNLQLIHFRWQATLCHNFALLVQAFPVPFNRPTRFFGNFSLLSVTEIFSALPNFLKYWNHTKHRLRRPWFFVSMFNIIRDTLPRSAKLLVKETQNIWIKNPPSLLPYFVLLVHGRLWILVLHSTFTRGRSLDDKSVIRFQINNSSEVQRLNLF